MNKLFLVGNGFDLAHGLKTKYSDFLLWYINKSIRSYHTNNSNVFEDDLLILNSNGYRVKEFDSLQLFNESLKSREIIFKCKNNFFDTILRQSADTNWVDIEYEYYVALLGIYKSIELQNIRRKDSIEKIVKEINTCFDFIKKQLIEYLQTITIETYNDLIKERLKDALQKQYKRVIFLVFNYTKTIDLYLDSLKMNPTQVIYIHGRLRNDKNPVIFGYGDEMDEFYGKLESLNINEFLRNMKSFNYLKTNNYQNLNGFLNDDFYEVSILGHSCGISDRVLLNSIFCHQNCVNIRLFYHQKSEKENDYFEKTQEISRHFALENKNKMRNMIVPFSESVSLT